MARIFLNRLKSKADLGLQQQHAGYTLTRRTTESTLEWQHYELDKYGFHEDDIDLFGSYLSNRKQIVKYHNEISHMCDIDNGVPQGSVLGPILFILYVNDINQHVHIGAACNLYPDDTLVYCSARNVDTLQECTNNSIACFKQWYDMNKLVINNTAKSNVMVISSKQRHVLSGVRNIDVRLGNEKIKQIDCIDYLVV